MTIPQRILLHVAAGAAVVIAVATAVTYGIVYDSAKQRDLKHLETYVRERARREEIGFRQVEINLNLVRGQFLKRMESPTPRNIEGQWNERFELYPDGAWRSRTNFVNGRKFSTLWAHKDVAFTPELKTPNPHRPRALGGKGAEGMKKGFPISKPLSAFLKQPAPPAAPEIDFPKANAEIAKTHFFELLDFVMQVCPPGPEEKETRARLASIGIGAGKKFDFKALPPAHQAAALEGVKAGMAKVRERTGMIGERINGWQVGSAFGDRQFYRGDWLLRAAAAQAGIFGNNADEAVYPMTRWLPDGEVLDTGKHRYTLTFPAGQLPPAKAFWSVTMYDGKTQLLIENSINRYLINSPMLPDLKKNDDGSLTLYIQKDSPGPDKEANWLPAPNGPIYMVMRLYWPSTEGSSILPPGEGSWNPPALQVAQ